MRHLKWLGALAALALLLLRPAEAAAGALLASARWYFSVAPALFPFLALMPLLSCSEAAKAYEALLGRVSEALFKLPGAAAPALVAGMLAGSPAGALAAADIARNGGMNRGQLRRAALSLAGFSPAFLAGGVGAGMLGDARLGWRLYGAQLLTQLTLLVALRGAWRDDTRPVTGAARVREARPVRDAVGTALGVCGYMALFGALNGAVRCCVPSIAADALLCLTDAPSGAALLAAGALPVGTRLVLLGALAGFGGACVIAQNLSALKGCGVRPGEYVAARLAAAGLTAGYASLPVLLAAAPGRAVRQALERPMALATLAVCLLAAPVLKKCAKTFVLTKKGIDRPMEL